MNIPFRRIGKTPQEFTLRSGNTEFKGTLELYGHSLVLLKGHLSGSINVDCDICAEAFDKILDEEIAFLISDGIFESENEEYDVVEIEDSVIDMEEILRSELELIRSDYHRCDKC